MKQRIFTMLAVGLLTASVMSGSAAAEEEDVNCLVPPPTQPSAITGCAMDIVREYNEEAVNTVGDVAKLAGELGDCLVDEACRIGFVNDGANKGKELAEAGCRAVLAQWICDTVFPPPP